MKKLRIDYLFVCALVLGGGAAVATSGPDVVKSNVATQIWYRTAANDTDSGTWVQGTSSGSCEESELLCSGVFEEGYQPNEHDDNINKQNNLSTTVNTGFVQQ
ncbi:hypothetical protein DSL64_16060 [Dyadobacter luteus]|uniref:Secreted protein n=1 Tax=Dyadobacter luteus TaxID=2259619 RepID=A0A3D8Y9N8_9BACT|nr:hypothetical protein [Dyadobacter luteus]REA60186.1 hypothetical protein DSL64_16060 [Dyadobacter luteus]